MNLKKASAASILLLAMTASQAHAFDFKNLKGKWLITNVEGRGLAQPIQFQPAAFGYDAVMPFFEGFSSITQSDGYKGSHLKIESKQGERCYYYLGVINDNKIGLSLAEGESPRCVKSAILERDP